MMARRRMPEYRIWRGMMQRCNNPKAPSFRRYGGRGIKVCGGWLSFDNFFQDMGPRPSEWHSIDRIDGDGPYAKENCRWATPTEQSRNRKNHRWLTHKGETRILAEWAERCGLHPDVLWGRLHRGWPISRALTEPVRKRSAA